MDGVSIFNNEDQVSQDFLSQIDEIKVNVNNGKPALKKPLLLLLVLSNYEHGYIKYNKIHFNDVEHKLNELIETFGGRPTKSGPKASHPFQYMNSSDFWHLKLPQHVIMTHSKDLPISVIRDRETFVKLDEDIYYLISNSSEARAKISTFILNKWWPETIQSELVSFLKLPVEGEVNKKRNREFTDLVLANYRYRCAVCGFDATVNKHAFGLDGAHIRWFSQNGPDSVENGLALCKIHHWAYDKGVISIEPNNFSITVSSKFVGRDPLSINLIEKLSGKEIYQYKDVPPSHEYLTWHYNYIYLDG